MIARSNVTIADVAREAGVSTQTVSRVLNNKGEISPETRRLVSDVIQRLGYRPNSVARSLVTRRTLSLGLVVPDITNPFFPEIARGAEDTALAAGYSVFLCNTTEQAEREVAVLRLLEEKRVDGVVVCSARLPDDQLVPLLRRQRTVVLVNRIVAGAAAGVVRVDDADGTRQAVRHLLGGGRRRLAMLSGPPASWGGRERVRGFREALQAAGLAVDPELILACPPYLDGGARAARRVLLSRRAVDGLVCYNDLVAIGALQACRELGARVPEDVAVVGCDDILLASLVTPPLSTIRVSKYDIGASAVRMLLDRIAAPGPEAAELVIRPTLVARASTPEPHPAAGAAGTTRPAAGGAAARPSAARAWCEPG